MRMNLTRNGIERCWIRWVLLEINNTKFLYATRPYAEKLARNKYESRYLSDGTNNDSNQSERQSCFDRIVRHFSSRLDLVFCF